MSSVNLAIAPVHNSTTANLENPQDQSSTFQACVPPLGPGAGYKPGDAVIYTIDQAAYNVHFDILASASPTFMTLLTPFSFSNWFQINETSSTFSTLLQLVYARDVPAIASFPALDAALDVCEKYGLRIMQKLLRGLLSDPMSDVFVEKDPLLAFGITLKYNFSAELTHASRFLIQSIDLRDTQSLQILRSSSTGSRIMSMLAFRHSKLADLLLSREHGVVLEKPNILKQLTCRSCFDNWRNLNPSHGHVHWIAQWIQDAYEILSHSCVTQQGRLFSIAYILEMMTGPKWCGACRTEIVANVCLYETWMKAIRDKLERYLVQELQV